MPLSDFTTLMVRGDRVRVHAVRHTTPAARTFTVVSAEGRVLWGDMKDVTSTEGYADIVKAALEGTINAASSMRHESMTQDQAASAFVEWWQKSLDDGFQYIMVP